MRLALEAAVEAGQAIMKIYEKEDFGVELKSDASPLTLADRAAHQVILKHLETSGIPVLSEEGKHLPFEQRKQWYELWIVDPVDVNEMWASREPVPMGAPSERPFTVVASRSHMSPETEAFVDEMRSAHGNVEFISKGSSLKLCMVAEGTADAYPRFAPTMEWDTAAGQAVCEASGCEVIDQNTGEPMRYNREELLNAWFLVTRRR